MFFAARYAPVLGQPKWPSDKCNDRRILRENLGIQKRDSSLKIKKLGDLLPARKADN
jgi:hypothetical protein